MHAWRDILRLSAEYLVQKGVPDAQVAAELLVARLLNCGRGFLSPHLGETPDPKYVEAMRRGIARLAAGEPVQYVLGEWDFRSLTLKCDRRALIPRPETEELVTRVLKFAKGYAAPRPFVVDVGTGSGCIVLSLAKEMADGIFLGLDISADAVALAQENAARCGLAERVKFAVADGLDDFDEPETVDVLVSNPPYIPTAAVERLDPKVLAHEPRLALDGGPDGMALLRQVAEEASMLLASGGGLFLELDAESGQARPMAAYLRELGFDAIRAHRDLAGAERFLAATLSDGL